MKIKFGILALIASIVLFGCATTNAVVNPSEIEFKEITGAEYCQKTGSWSSYEANSKLSSLYASTKGYKLTDVYITGAGEETLNNGTKEIILGLKAPRNGNEVSVYAKDFLTKILQNDATWADRLDSVQNDEKFNGHYTVWLYAQQEGNFLDGYTTKVFVYNIEGIPSQEEIDAAKAAAEAERIAKEEAEKKAKAEKYAALNAKAKTLAQGYTYHGIEEVEKNCKLFINGALESGHAYYISGFVVKYGGSMAKIEYGDGFFFSSQSSAVYVDYISQKVKGEVVEAGVTNLFGQSIETPLTVVVAGGKGYSKTPVVLGIVEEK